MSYESRVTRDAAPAGRISALPLPSERLMALGATILTLGLALSLIEPGEASGLLTGGGFAVLLLGLHRFGRSGSTPP